MIAFAAPGERRGKQGEGKSRRPEQQKYIRLLEQLICEIPLGLCG
jgi:hypothetical protein